MLRGSLEQVRSGVATAERGVASSRGHLEYRRQALSTARRALTVSEEKTARVAREAPEFRSKADEGRADSAPMVRQTRQKAGENTRRSPEDGEAAGNARRQGRQLSRVADGATTIDRTIAQTRDRAGSLAEEAARAQGLNEQTRGKLDEADATLAGTTGRIGELDRQTRDARTQVEALAAQPDQLVAQAEALDQQGLRLIEASHELERRLHQVERSYEQGMRGVPAARPAAQSPEEEPVRRNADDDSYEGRERIDPVSALPSWLTGAHGPTEQQRRESAAAEQQRRRAEIAEIRARAGGNFANLSAGEKMGIALRLAGRNLFRSVGNIRWPGFGALALGLIDPRGPLSGVLGGLGMMLSGGANLLSAEQWRRDPLGNALKSAADIATGLTVILGSITALAGVIAAAMTALTILSLGFAAPITGPIIAFCTAVMIAVGGWTIAVGKIALVLQALVLIKNLIDAATARTAEDLQSQSEQIRADVGNAGNVLMQMGMAKLAQMGGRTAQGQIRAAGGGVRFAARMGAGARTLPGKALGAMRQAGFRGVMRGAGGLVVRGVAAGGKGIATGVRALGRGIGRTGGRIWKGIRGVGSLGRRGLRGLRPSSLRTLPGRALRGIRGAPGRLWRGAGRRLSRFGRRTAKEFRRSDIVGDDIHSLRDAWRAAEQEGVRLPRFRGPGRAPAGSAGPRVVAERRIPGTTHRAKVLSDGRVLICSRCEFLEQTYRELLEEFPALRQRLDQLKARATTGAADDLAEFALELDLATRAKVRSDAALTRAIAADIANPATPRMDLERLNTMITEFQPGGMGGAADDFLREHGYSIYYRGQDISTPKIRSYIGRESGLRESRAFHRRMLEAGLTREEIAGFTARYQHSMGSFETAGGPLTGRLGGTGIPATRTPGIAAGINPAKRPSDIIYVVRVPRGSPHAPVFAGPTGWPGLSTIEREFIFFNEIPRKLVVGSSWYRFSRDFRNIPGLYATHIDPTVSAELAAYHLVVRGR
ncbi:MAG: hypothetical protein GY856_26100 [bacterium]|nr:hypothetical protein [bacterium]